MISVALSITLISWLMFNLGSLWQAPHSYWRGYQNGKLDEKLTRATLHLHASRMGWNSASKHYANLYKGHMRRDPKTGKFIKSEGVA